jgi:Polysaccharide pyruvyl transferase
VRKIAVFNDTRPMRHFGCDAVMAAIEDNITARGGEVILRHPVGRSWDDDPVALAALAAADIVLINGEATMHRDLPVALRWSKLGPYCSAIGKPCYLVNATVQQIKGIVPQNLATFSGIWVRDSRSAAELRHLGIAGEMTGDLTFFHDLPRHCPTEARGLVLDSADIRHDMGAVAAALRLDYVAMRYSNRGLKAYRKQFLRWQFERGKPSIRIAGITTFQKFAAYLASRPFVVTGRFHGLCFAVNCGIPFTAISLSNWKTDAMLDDIGIGADRLYQPGQVPEPLDAGELDLMARYKADVQQRIAAMFGRILPAEPHRP